MLVLCEWWNNINYYPKKYEADKVNILGWGWVGVKEEGGVYSELRGGAVHGDGRVVAYKQALIVSPTGHVFLCLLENLIKTRQGEVCRVAGIFVVRPLADLLPPWVI